MGSYHEFSALAIIPPIVIFLPVSATSTVKTQEVPFRNAVVSQKLIRELTSPNYFGLPSIKYDCFCYHLVLSRQGYKNPRCLQVSAVAHYSSLARDEARAYAA